MIHQQAIDRLDRLAALLERARDSVRTDAGALTALLDETTVTLETVGAALRESAASGAPDSALLASVSRVRASHAALHRVLRDELSALGRQIAHAESVTDGASRYSFSTGTGHRLDRRG